MSLPTRIILDGTIYIREGYQIGVATEPQPHLETLKKILSGAGITWDESQLYITSSAAKWAGEHNLAVEVRPGTEGGEWTIFVHPPNTPHYFGATRTTTVSNAIEILKAVKKAG
jgi:hypothetical protein